MPIDNDFTPALEEASARTRLNNAAPDMLAALQAVIEWYSVTPVDEDWSPCMIQAAAAIAKATRS